MCKLFIATGPMSRRQIDAALLKANEVFRKTEHDGFGFLAAKGLKCARGRYLDPTLFVGHNSDLPAWLSGPKAEENVLPTEADVLIVHGRTSTNAKGLQNVHPFYCRAHYLAHNGIVHWEGGLESAKPPQECDSEQLLHWLMENEYDWDKAKKFWAGWGAIADYDVKAGVLTIVRYGATLFIARRAKKRGWVFATSREQLLAVCHAANIRLDTPPIPLPQYLVKIAAGEITTARAWNGFGTRQWTRLDALSWGTTDKVKKGHKVKWITNLKDESNTLFPDYEPGAK